MIRSGSPCAGAHRYTQVFKYLILDKLALSNMLSCIYQNQWFTSTK